MAVVSARGEWGKSNNTKDRCLLSFSTGVAISQEPITIQAQVRDEKMPLPLYFIYRGVRGNLESGDG